MAKHGKGFGRELERIIPLAEELDASPKSTELMDIPVSEIQPNPAQPRKSFDQEKLAELSRTIRANGVVQPIVVRRSERGGYEIVAGERRWRAAKLAELTTVPAVVRDVSEKDLLALALLENIQREDLNPIEEARALMQLVHDFSATHGEVGDFVGRSRSTVSNLIRLLDLSEPVQELVVAGQLEMGHARALLAIENDESQLGLANAIVANKHSVRQAEQLVRKAQQIPQSPTIGEPATTPMLPEQWRHRVEIKENRLGRSNVTLRNLTNEELKRLLTFLRD